MSETVQLLSRLPEWKYLLYTFENMKEKYLKENPNGLQYSSDLQAALVNMSNYLQEMRNIFGTRKKTQKTANFKQMHKDLDDAEREVEQRMPELPKNLVEHDSILGECLIECAKAAYSMLRVGNCDSSIDAIKSLMGSVTKNAQAQISMEAYKGGGGTKGNDAGKLSLSGMGTSTMQPVLSNQPRQPVYHTTPAPYQSTTSNAHNTNTLYVSPKVNGSFQNGHAGFKLVNMAGP